MGLFGVTASSEFGGSDMTYLDQVGIASISISIIAIITIIIIR